MKRELLIACAVLLSAESAQAQKSTVKKAPTPATKAPAPRPVPTATLANFTFKEAIAGDTMDPKVIGSCSPDQDGIPGKLECRGRDNVVAGISLTVAPTYSFYNDRLTGMLFLYANDGVNFLTLFSAFTEKYGKPCENTSEKWQNKAGSTFDNALVTWCFKTGKLKLEQIGPSLKYGVVSYDDVLSAPTKAPPKDF